MNRNYKQKLKKWNISSTEMAEMLGYASLASLRNSSAYEKRIDTFLGLIAHIEQELINRIRA